MSKKFYLTTTIPYVNARAHVGHALEYVQADVLARYHRQLDEDVFFLTGTDENSLKNYQAAKEEGIATQELVERNSELFRELCLGLSISFDDFIRTTEKKHIKGAQKLWQVCQKDIYKKKYQGLYCVGCEMFLKENELVNGVCPDHKTKPELIKEENYFFKLSNYQKQLEKIIKSEELKITPENRRNEALSFIKSGLEDFSISRSAQRAEGWGVPVPGDKTQIEYVWFDALGNYLTALGYGSDNLEKFNKYWPADLHCLGKGVSRFHVIYWPAMLLSAGLFLPKAEFIHGYLTIDGQKISKSLGNVIDPLELVKKYGVDAVRYYLLREFSSTADGDFSLKRLEERYNGDLANGLGNLVSRVLVLALTSLPTASHQQPTIKNKELREEIKGVKKDYAKALEEIKFNEALEAVWQLIGFCDSLINQTKLWELVKTSPEKAKEVLSDLIETIKEIAGLLTPFLPQTSQKILEQIKLKKKPEPLFPRLG